VTISANYRLSRTEFGGNYTLSRLRGNFIGENTGSGPLTSALLSYPEYHQDAWFVPIGDLEADQRHRASLWMNYGVPRVSGLTLSLLQDLGSGMPYGASGTVDARLYVPSSIASRYAAPQGGTTEMYFYTARDAFRTESNRRTDFAANYTYGIGVGARKIDAFVQAQIINLFSQQHLCACGAADVFANGGASGITRIGTSVLSPANSTAMARFDPFSQSPVLGTNWNHNPNFGTPLNRQAFTVHLEHPLQQIPELISSASPPSGPQVDHFPSGAPKWRRLGSEQPRHASCSCNPPPGFRRTAEQHVVVPSLPTQLKNRGFPSADWLLSAEGARCRRDVHLLTYEPTVL
jgi:hypothetical protein